MRGVAHCYGQRLPRIYVDSHMLRTRQPLCSQLFPSSVRDKLPLVGYGTRGHLSVELLKRQQK